MVMARKSKVSGLLALLAGFLGGGLLGCNPATSSGEYLTQPVRLLTLEAKVVANGTVNPVTTVLVGSQVSGKITEIFVDYNSPVKVGQVVARIDPSLFEAKVAQARASLRQSQADVAKARANLELAATEHHRFQTLWQQNLVARDESDKARNTYHTAQADLQAAQARVGQAVATLNDAETNLSYTTIISPVAGTVVSRNVDVGQTVASSFQTPTLFTIAQDLTRMQVETAVDEAEVGKVKEGQEASFTVDAYPDTTFTGKVTQARLAPTTVQNVVTYTVVVQADNPQLLLRPGMTATVRIMVARRAEVLAIPNSALRFQPKEKKAEPLPAGSVIWRLGPQGKPQPVPVTLGISDGVSTELKESPLKEGEPVIVGRKETSPTRTPQPMRGPF